MWRHSRRKNCTYSTSISANWHGYRERSRTRRNRILLRRPSSVTAVKRGPTGNRHVPQRFRNRQDAGRQLAASLDAYRNRPDVVVLGLPRGGVPVAYEV